MSIEEIDYALMDKSDIQLRDALLKRLYFIIIDAHDEVNRWNKPLVDTQKAYLQWEKDYSNLKNNTIQHIQEIHGLIDKYMVDWQTVQKDWRRTDGTQEEDYWWIQG